MLTRRAFLQRAVQGFGGLGAAALLPLPSLGAAACSRPKPTLQSPRETEHRGVGFVELFPNGADEAAPLLVAIHGRGDRPQNWIQGLRAFPARVQIALPRAFEAFGDGWSWFPSWRDRSEAEFARAMADAGERLWTGIRELAGARSVLVTGFSQGGMLSYFLATRHAAEIIHAFPVAGFLPAALRPAPGAAVAPITAFHGTADEVIPFAWGRETVDALASGRSGITLRDYPRVPHAISAPERAELWSAIADAVPPAR